MGAWGTGSFDDDSALDWLRDLRESEDPQRLVAEQVQRAADSSSNYLDSGATAGCQLRAAAELIAAAGGAPSRELLEMKEEAEWLASGALRFDRELARDAREALGVLVDPNRCELAALWVNESFAAPDAEWRAAVGQLAERLDRLLGTSRRLPSVPLTRWTIEPPEDVTARLELLRELVAENGSLTAGLRQLAEADRLVARAIAEQHALVVVSWIRATFDLSPGDAEQFRSWEGVGGNVSDEELDRLSVRTTPTL